MAKKKAAVIGAGSWGTALAQVLADNGHSVQLWGRRGEQSEEINQTHINSRYLPDVVLNSTIKAYSDLSATDTDNDYIICAVPTKAIRETIKQIRPLLHEHSILVHASKGIEPGTFKRISEMMEEELDGASYNAVAVLSGPSHAEEVGIKQPTTVTVSSKHLEAAAAVQDLFMNNYFRVYTNEDMIGVEIGGALKNIIALGIGMTDGLGYGDNTKAALMTRGLAEITRLGVALGANPMTFIGLSGLGDLIVTCTSEHSRNWRAGHLLGKGKKLDDVLDEMGMVVEGVRTTKAVFALAQAENVEMPITSALYSVLFEEEPPLQAADRLMGRMKKNEEESSFMGRNEGGRES